jgi:hypothetical protein
VEMKPFKSIAAAESESQTFVGGNPEMCMDNVDGLHTCETCM